MNSILSFFNKPRSERGLLHRVLLEWTLLSIVLLGTMYALTHTRAMISANHYAYDRLLPLIERQADQNIVLVTIDEESMMQLGQWPWSRKVHAQLFDLLNAQKPKGILFDVILTETASQPQDDILLGQAMGKGPVKAPVLMHNDGFGTLTTIKPVAQVAQNAQLGHIAILPDEDGVVRQAMLTQTDSAGQTWPLLTTLLLPPQARSSNPKLEIPFNVPQGSYLTFSYSDVLAGRVPDGFLQDKYILVGANSTGLGDQYPTPSSGRYSLMPGIEIHANILDALLNHIQIITASSPWFTLLPVFVMLFALLWVRERFHLLAFAVGGVLYTVLVYVLLWRFYIWLPPMTSLLGLTLAYVLWSWRRLAVMLQYMRNELILLQEQTGRLSNLLPSNRERKGFRPHHLELNIKHALHLSHFVGESLQQLPVAMVLVDEYGQILLHNQLAQQDFGLAIKHTSIFTLLQQMDNDAKRTPQPSIANLAQKELHTADGRTYALHVKPIHFKDLEQDGMTAQQHTIWQISWIDLSKERAAQAQHNHLMMYLSHDMRAPQVGILALLDIFKSSKSNLTLDQMLPQIANKVHRTLDDANALVQLARAQNGNNYQMEETNLIEIIYLAVEQTQAQAMAKHINLSIDVAMNEYFNQTWVHGDGAMMTRMMVNLLTNAVRYSPNESQITVDLSLKPDENSVCCRIQDNGQGMSADQVAQLNQLMSDGGSPSLVSEHKKNHPDAAGSMGVGLYMVAAVMRRHNGTITFASSAGNGTTVSMCLPTISDSEEFDI